MSKTESFGGKRIDNAYQLTKVIGSGASATVYDAFDIHTRKPVAVKLFSSNTNPFDIEKEAKTQARLHHPNILPFYWYGQEEEHPYIAMMRANQGSLAESLRTNGTPPIETSIRYVLEASQGVAYAHKEGVVHRDLKPANLLLHPDQGKIVKVSDWGIAVKPRSADPESTDQIAKGTMRYAAPELFKGQSVFATDTYALGGVIAYELLTGALPIEEGKNIEEHLHNILFQQPKSFREQIGGSMTTLHEALEEPVQKALRKKPEERHESMEAYAEELATAYVHAKETSQLDTTIIDLAGSKTRPDGTLEYTDIPDTERIYPVTKKLTDTLVDVSPDGTALRDTISEILDGYPGEREYVADLRSGANIDALLSDDPKALRKLREFLKIRLHEAEDDRAATRETRLPIYAVRAGAKRDYLIRLLSEVDSRLHEHIEEVTDPLLAAEKANPMIERAKEILGEDFFGIEAIRKLETVLKMKNLDLEFGFDELPEFPYTEQDILLAKEFGERLVLRTDIISFNHVDRGLNLFNLGKCIDSKPDFPTYTKIIAKKDRATSKQFSDRVYRNISKRWAIVKKEPMRNESPPGLGSTDRNFEGYRAALKRKGATNIEITRPSALELLWDNSLFAVRENYPISAMTIYTTHINNIVVYAGYSEKDNSIFYKELEAKEYINDHFCLPSR